jgi:hypothetical protein
MSVLLLSDFTLEDSIAGGSELVDDTISKTLNLNIVRARTWVPSTKDFLIISNISTLDKSRVEFIKSNCNYIIIEHDYKIHWTRHPWRFKDSIVPKTERINYDLYKRAKAVFTQTDDHLQVFKNNEVEANFISLKSSIWSDEELERVSSLQNNKRTHKFAVIDSDNWIKNKQGAEEFCKINKLDYSLIPKSDYHTFIERLSEYPALVFFPIARETCCRLLVEARCMNMNTITSDNSGAFKSDWFYQSGDALIDFLKNQSKLNLKNIMDLLG